jgi:hypothetical protein
METEMHNFPGVAKPNPEIDKQAEDCVKWGNHVVANLSNKSKAIDALLPENSMHLS